jgi:hypothetical protein
VPRHDREIEFVDHRPEPEFTPGRELVVEAVKRSAGRRLIAVAKHPGGCTVIAGPS